MKRVLSCLIGLNILIGITPCVYAADIESLSPTEPKGSIEENESFTIKGVIVDKSSGEGIKDVYMKQKDSLNAGFTDKKGNFSLKILKGFPQILIFTKDGYESVSIEVKSSTKPLKIELLPITVYKSDVPSAHTDEKQGALNIFDNQFSAFYQAHYGYDASFGDNPRNMSGWGINELGVNGAFMLKPWMIKANVFRNRLPVNVEDFPYQPAFYTNNMQVKVGAGYVWKLNPSMEMYLGSDIVMHNISPDNKNGQDKIHIAYTGSLTDYEQNRFLLGLNCSLGWAVNDYVTLFPEINILPLGINNVQDDRTNPSYYTFGLGAGIKSKIRILPGIHLVAFYENQLWGQMEHFDDLNMFGLGVSIDPWKTIFKY